MTEFEQQIAAILTETLHYANGGGIVGLSRARATADQLAPRVAAAIEAALPLGASVAGWNDMREGFKQAALDALRGGPPAAPPPP